MEVEDETNEIFCKGEKVGERYLSRKFSGTLIVEKTSPLLLAFGYGSTIGSKTIKVAKRLQGYSEESTGNDITSTVTTFTIGTGHSIAKVSAGDCQSLHPIAINLGSANLDPNTYHYNSTTGVLTLAQGVFSDGTKLIVDTYKDQVSSVVSARLKNTQLEVMIDVERTNSETVNTTLSRISKATLTSGKAAFDEDGDTVEFAWSAALTKDDDVFHAFY